MTALAIESRGLGRRYGGIDVLRDVDLRLPEGSRTALLGANGAGKTTLLRVLATLVSPSMGDAAVAGWSVRDRAAPMRRQIGVLLHQPMLYEELTPLENLRFFARLYDVPDAEQRIEDLLRAVGLWLRRHEPAEVLSRGYHQRLALARALVHAPSVLLVDEPETGLDTEGMALLDELVLRRDGITVLAATHRADRAGEWATGVVRLDRGRVVEDTASVEAVTA
jgi:heme exporter protein A